MPVVLRRILMVVLAIVIVAAIVVAMWPEPVPVDLGRVVRGAMQVTVDEEGRTRIRDRYVVSAPLAGRLRRIELDPGDPVSAQSTVLAIIEPTDPVLLDARARAEAEHRVNAAEAAVQRSAAEIERTRSTYDFAEDELARIRDAHGRTAATDREVREKEMLYRIAQQAHHGAQHAADIAAFELEQARSALIHTRLDEDGVDELQFLVHAPISGCVLRVFQESVAVVAPGAALLEVGDPGDLEVVVDVLSTDAVKIRPGGRLIIDRWGGDEPLEATVRLVEPSAFTKVSALGVEEQRVNVIADFVSPVEARPTLGDGFRVEGRIVIWEGADVTLVPTSALFRDEGRWAVFAVDAGRVALRHVDVDHQNGTVAEVTAGLEPGDTVVIHPSDELRDGGRVEPRAGGRRRSSA